MAVENLKSSGAAARLAGKYLTFTLQGESYGIDVMNVREIIRTITITAVPRMPAFVRGVVNLRGKIIPVMDLRLRLGFNVAAAGDETCIIVVQVRLGGGKSAPMGLVVDGVEEVLTIPGEDIQETPNFGGQITTDYIVGMARVKGTVKTLLDIDGVMTADALKSLRIAAACSF